MKVDSKLLLDNWSESGVGIDSLKETMEAITNITSFDVVKCHGSLPEEGIYHLTAVEEDEDGVGIVRALKDGRSPARLKSKSTELAREAVRTSGQALYLGGKCYFVSEKAFFTLSQRVGFDEAIYVKCPERERFMASIMEKKPAIWQLMVKEIGNFRKVFAVFTDRYKPIPQTFVTDLAETLSAPSTAMGKGEVDAWYTCHDYTEAHIIYRDKAKECADTYGIKDFIPAVRITTSDMGKASLTVQAVWRHGNSYAVCEELKFAHKGSTTTSDIAEKVGNVLFPRFSKLPEALANLMGIQISPEEVVVSSLYEEENEKAVGDFIDYLVDEINLIKAIGKGNTKRIKELMLDEMDMRETFTAYDIVTSFMDMPDRLKGLKPSLMKPFEKACGLAPFVEIEDSDLFLTA